MRVACSGGHPPSAGGGLGFPLSPRWPQKGRQVSCKAGSYNCLWHRATTRRNPSLSSRLLVSTPRRLLPVYRCVLPVYQCLFPINLCLLRIY